MDLKGILNDLKDIRREVEHLTAAVDRVNSSISVGVTILSLSMQLAAWFIVKYWGVL